MPHNGRYYTRPLFARDHVNKQHINDKIDGSGEKPCTATMMNYLFCLEKSKNDINRCYEAANEVRMCMERHNEMLNAKTGTLNNKNSKVQNNANRYLRLPKVLNHMRHLK